MSSTTTERAGSVEFRVLGNVEILTDGRVLALDGRKAREVLAYLLLHANQVVTHARMIEALWGEDAPLTVDSSLRVAISKLRKALEPIGVRDRLETHQTGYLLRVEPSLVDAGRFEALAADGRRGRDDHRWDDAVRCLGEALSLWRGDPYPELGRSPEATKERQRLTSRRLDVQDDLSDVQLALGRHETLVPELEALVAEQTTRERRAAQLMLALYRSDRQTEALEVYARTRAALNEEVGLEPGPALRDLQQAILIQSPTLDAPRPTPPAALSPAPPPTETATTVRPSRFRTRRWLVVPVAAAAIVVVAGTFALVDRGRGGTVTVSADSVAVVGRPQNDVTRSVPTGGRPTDVVLADGAAWIANAEEATVTQVDVASHRVVRTIGIGFEPTGIAAGRGAVWVVGGYDHRLARIDTGDGGIRLRVRFQERLGPLPVGYQRGPAGVAVGPDGVWVSHGVEVTRFDPGTGAVERTARAGGPWSSAIAVGDGYVWVGTAGVLTRTGVIRPNPALEVVPLGRGRAARLPVVSNVGDIEIRDGWAWAALPIADAVWRIDPRPLTVDATFPAGDKPVSIAVDGGVWISNSADATVTKLDETSGRRLDTIAIGHTLEGLAASGSEVWVAVRRP